MKLFLLLTSMIVFFGCKQTSESDYSKLEKEATPKIDKFFKNMKGGDTLALKALLESNQYLETKDSLTQDLLYKFNLLNQTEGQILSSEIIYKKIINEGLGTFSYLVRYERKFYRFIFTFYNNTKSTEIFKFSIDEQVGAELEESLRIYYINILSSLHYIKLVSVPVPQKSERTSE